MSKPAFSKYVHDFINSHTAPLYTLIYSNDYFFFDYWSFCHLANGALVLAILKKLGLKRPLAVLFPILFGWELIEMSFVYFSVELFNPEILPDQLTDIAVGFAGGILASLIILPKKRIILQSDNAMEIAIPCAMSIFWVSAYGYSYNIDALNSPFINWFAFVIWSAGLMATIRVYKLFDRHLSSLWFKIPFLWIAYFSGLLAIEYTGYYILHIRLITDEKPLTFGLIHGTPLMKIYYLTAGPAAVAINAFLEYLHIRHIKNPSKKKGVGRWI